jgi:hypothetical protein
MNLIGTILVYAALAAMFLGCVSVVRPLSFLGIASRLLGIVVFLCGVAAFLVGVHLPAGETRIGAKQSVLDDFIPVYQFHEFHETRIHARREAVFKAIKEVRANEIFLFRTLTWIRRFGRSAREDILNPPEGELLLAVALRTSFMKLAEEPDREIVVGTLAAAPKGTRLKKGSTPNDFKALNAPGFALAALNFRLEDAAPGETVLTTETRVYATDASTRKRFGAYWRLIYPGSALIRVAWLRAIRRRAEGGNL